METYKITYYYEGKYNEYTLKAGNILIALGEFNYNMPYEKIYKIELIVQ